MTPTQAAVPAILFVILLVVGILAVQALIWIPIIIALKRKSARLHASLRDELAAGERAARGPESAVYRGATAGFPMVKGNGVAVLTDRRLIFRKLVGAGLEVPLDRVAGVREDTWFLGGYRNGRMHLILRMQDGNEVGFMFADHPGWMASVRDLTTNAA